MRVSLSTGDLSPSLLGVSLVGPHQVGGKYEDLWGSLSLGGLSLSFGGLSRGGLSLAGASLLGASLT